jgi:hypothetical protein
MSMGFFCLFGASAIVKGVLTAKDAIVGCFCHGKEQANNNFKKSAGLEKRA